MHSCMLRKTMDLHTVSLFASPSPSMCVEYLPMAMPFSCDLSSSPMCVSKYNHNDTDLLTTNRSSLFFSYVCECTHNDTDNDTRN